MVILSSVAYLCLSFIAVLYFFFFFFKQKTAYEMRISDWSSDVCSSDLKNMGLPAIDEAKPYKEQLLAFIDELKALPEAEATLANLRLLPDVRHEDDTCQLIETLGQLLQIAVDRKRVVSGRSG